MILNFNDLSTSLVEVSSISGEKEFVIVGSASIISSIQGGSRLSNSRDIDGFPVNRNISDDVNLKLIDLLGEGSKLSGLPNRHFLRPNV